MGLTVNIDKAEVYDNTPLKKGNYPVMFMKYEEKDASDEGDPVVQLRYELTADQADEELVGKLIIKKYTLSDKAVGFLNNDLVALGADPDIFKAKGDVNYEVVLDSVKGDKAVAVVGDPSKEYPDLTNFRSLRPLRSAAA